MGVRRGRADRIINTTHGYSKATRQAVSRPTRPIRRVIINTKVQMIYRSPIRIRIGVILSGIRSYRIHQMVPNDTSLGCLLQSSQITKQFSSFIHHHHFPFSSVPKRIALLKAHCHLHNYNNNKVAHSSYSSVTPPSTSSSSITNNKLGPFVTG